MSSEKQIAAAAAEYYEEEVQDVDTASINNVSSMIEEIIGCGNDFFNQVIAELSALPEVV